MEETCSSSQSLNGDYFDATLATMRGEMATLPAEQGEDMTAARRIAARVSTR